jgi:hypothetical protein
LGGNPPRAGRACPGRKRLGASRGHLGRDQVENLRRAGGPETDPLIGPNSETRWHRRAPSLAGRGEAEVRAGRPADALAMPDRREP